MDHTLSCFDLAMGRALTLERPSVNMAPEKYAWTLMSALGCEPQKWTELAIRFRGQLPSM